MPTVSSEPPSVLDAGAALELVGSGLADGEELGVFAGRPVVAVAVDGDPRVDDVAAILRDVPCLTVGVAPAGADLGTPPDFDVLVAEAADAGRPWVGCEDLGEALGDLHSGAGVDGAPAVVLAQLLRLGERLSVADALVAESLVYSMLQSGPGQRRWLDERGPLAHRQEDGPAVLVERDGGALQVTLNRPAVHNAYDARMRDELVAALQVAVVDPTIDTVSLAGRGPSFCSGGDLSEFGTLPDPVTAHLVRTSQSAGAWLARCADRTTASVHGTCIGAGTELPAFCARVVARPDATFRLPEVAMGLIPGAGGTASLPRRIGRQRTAFLAVTGRALDADGALDWGLVDAIDPAP